jgi:hypothetical protein
MKMIAESFGFALQKLTLVRESRFQFVRKLKQHMSLKVKHKFNVSDFLYNPGTISKNPSLLPDLDEFEKLHGRSGNQQHGENIGIEGHSKRCCYQRCRFEHKIVVGWGTLLLHGCFFDCFVVMC